MAPSVVESTVSSFFSRQLDSNSRQTFEGKTSLAERDLNDNGNAHSMSNAGKIAAIVVPVVLIVLGLIISGGIYSHRRCSQAKKTGNLIVPHYPETLPKKAPVDLSAPDSQGTFLVALPTSSQGITSENAKIGVISDKPRVLYVAPGEDPSPAPLKKGNEGSHSIPALKINTSALTPPTAHGQTPSPSLSPRTVASKSPARYSTRLSTNSNLSYRLVVVESTFPPSLADELEIQVGEQLHLIEEYEDEWCLVQRIGSKEKGVVPRLCVIEKDRTPSTKNVFRFSAQAIAASKASRV